MKHQDYFFITLLFLSFLLIRDYISYLLFSLVIFGLSYPIFVKISRYIKIKSLAASFSILLILSIFATSLYIVLYNMYLELSNIYPYLISISNKYEILRYISSYSSYVLHIIYEAFSSFAKDLLGYFISLFASYYLLLYKEEIEEYIKNYMSLDIDKLKSTFYGIFVGHFLFWILQAVLSYLGFILMDLKYATLLSLLVFVFAILPIFGPWTVWLGITTYFFISNNYFLAVISFIYGVVFVSVLTEVLIKPLIVGKYAGINPLLVFLGIVGGISLFGISGIFIGPLILEFSKDYILEYLREKNSL